MIDKSAASLPTTLSDDSDREVGETVISMQSVILILTIVRNCVGEWNNSPYDHIPASRGGIYVWNTELTVQIHFTNNKVRVQLHKQHTVDSEKKIITLFVVCLFVFIYFVLLTK